MWLPLLPIRCCLARTTRTKTSASSMRKFIAVPAVTSTAPATVKSRRMGQLRPILLCTRLPLDSLLASQRGPLRGLLGHRLRRRQLPSKCHRRLPLGVGILPTTRVLLRFPVSGNFSSLFHSVCPSDIFLIRRTLLASICCLVWKSANHIK